MWIRRRPSPATESGTASAGVPLRSKVSWSSPQEHLSVSAVFGGLGGLRDQPVVQERIWALALLLPFIIVVKPKVLPLPLGRIVIT